MEKNRNDKGGGEMFFKNLAESPGFRMVHILFIVTSVITGITGSFMYNEGFSVIPAITGVLISAATVWYMIKGWQEHKYTEGSLSVSVALYSVAMIDEWGNMMAKGIGGAIAEAYFGWFIASSIVVILGLWVRLELFNDDYREARAAKAMQLKEVRAKRQLLSHERLNRIAAKEEALLKNDLARRGRRVSVMALYRAIISKLNSRATRKRIKISAQAQVNELLLSTGIVEGGSGKKIAAIEWNLTPTPSGDGAASLT